MDQKANGIIVTLDPFNVYDYQELREKALCPSCGNTLYWMINPNNKDDKFCIASCCGMQYYMVPEAVRVISIAVAEAPNREYECIAADEEFLKELQQM